MRSPRVAPTLSLRDYVSGRTGVRGKLHPFWGTSRSSVAAAKSAAARSNTDPCRIIAWRPSGTATNSTSAVRPIRRATASARPGPRSGHRCRARRAPGDPTGPGRRWVHPGVQRHHAAASSAPPASSAARPPSECPTRQAEGARSVRGPAPAPRRRRPGACARRPSRGRSSAAGTPRVVPRRRGRCGARPGSSGGPSWVGLTMGRPSRRAPPCRTRTAPSDGSGHGWRGGGVRLARGQCSRGPVTPTPPVGPSSWQAPVRPNSALGARSNRAEPIR